ncbi:hypothetical protein HNQ71_007067 [Mesorhizobium sangaii]|uniref:Uncharacterized protein n=1 Tax=Mesorhizobium sangaii TaxID=505389 RepID=A0A841PGQ1_9HYPH|nr:hypothetical protein [Mesorhizobium sangaii]
MPPLPYLAEPEARRILIAASPTQSGASAMNHQRAQIAIAAFADAEQAGSPSTGSLLRHQTKPGGELAAVLEAGPIAHGSDQGCRRHRANAFDLPKPLALLTGAEDFPYPPVIGRNPMVEFDQFDLQLSHQRPDHFAESVSVILDDHRKAAPQRFVCCDHQRAPIPRKQVIEPGDRRVGDAGENIGKPGLRIDVVELCGFCRPPNYAGRARFRQCFS